MEKFGITTQTEDLSKLLYVCMCGHKWSVDRPITDAPVCAKCGNTDFKHVSNGYHGGKITSGAKLQVIENGDWGFIAKKYCINTRYARKNFTLIYESNTESFITFDFRNNVFTIEAAGRNERIDIDNMRGFMSDLEEGYFISTVCTAKMRTFLTFGKNQFGQGTGWNRYYGNSPKAHLCNSMTKLAGFVDAQILCNAGFSSSRLANYCSLINNKESKVDRRGTRPHEILNVAKYMVKYIVELDLMGSYHLSHLRVFNTKFGADGSKAIFQKMTEEADNNAVVSFLSNVADDFVDMVDKYKYNPQQLITYVFRDVKLQQGIASPYEALKTLRDYMNMMTIMELHPDKYTKSLKKDHDIAQMNFKTQEDEFTKREFTKAIESDSYVGLEYKSGEYAFVTPKTPKDIVREGDSLSHCVASYVKDVVKGKCKIFFLRRKEDLDKSLITLELRGSRIVQARGFGNRSPNVAERALMKKWAEKKQLELAC